MKSALIRQMREDREKLDSKKLRTAEKAAQRDVEVERELKGEKKEFEV
jgi:hypothetical protein